jgi:hypothetical protein
MEAEMATKYKISHQPPDLSPDKIASRKMLLSLAAQLLALEADAEFEKAVEQYKIYKEMSK